MTRLLPSLLLFGACALLASGCAIGTQKTGRVIDVKAIADVKVGESTKQDVLDLFGPPTTYNRVAAFPFESLHTRLKEQAPIESKESEDVFTYEYREINENFFTLLLYTFFERDTVEDVLMVFFDHRDKVKYVSFAKQTDAEVEETE